MKTLSKELQLVYDFCERQKNNLDNAKTDDFNAKIILSSQATIYWVVQQFIEVNFMDE